MEFEGQYLTYEDYKALGGTLDLTSFNLLEFEARRQVDIRTQNRLKESKEVPQEVKLCIFKLIENINSYTESKNKISESGNIASVSTDGYSESYVTSAQISSIIQSHAMEIQDTIRTYLLGVIYDGEHLMFRGIDNANKYWFNNIS